MEQSQLIKCPICGNKDIEYGEAYAYCGNYKPVKKGDEWINEGTCDFKIYRSSQLFKKTLTNQDIQKLLAGDEIRDTEGNTMKINIDNAPYYSEITLLEKQTYAKDREAVKKTMEKMTKELDRPVVKAVFERLKNK